MSTIFLSDNWLRVEAENEKTGDPLTSAAVTLTDLRNKSTNQRPAGFDGTPLEFDAVGDTPGTYELLLDRDVLALERSKTYIATIDIDGGAGLRRTVEGLLVIRSPQVES